MLREKKIFKGHLPRVIYHQLYSYAKDFSQIKPVYLAENPGISFEQTEYSSADVVLARGAAVRGTNKPGISRGYTRYVFRTNLSADTYDLSTCFQSKVLHVYFNITHKDRAV